MKRLAIVAVFVLIGCGSDGTGAPGTGGAGAGGGRAGASPGAGDAAGGEGGAGAAGSVGQGVAGGGGGSGGEATGSAGSNAGAGGGSATYSACPQTRIEAPQCYGDATGRPVKKDSMYCAVCTGYDASGVVTAPPVNCTVTAAGLTFLCVAACSECS